MVEGSRREERWWERFAKDITNFEACMSPTSIPETKPLPSSTENPLLPWKNPKKPPSEAAAAIRNSTAAAIPSSSLQSSSPSPSSLHETGPQLSADSSNVSLKKTVEDVTPIATGHEREEPEAEHEGRKRSDTDAPVGSLGTRLGAKTEGWEPPSVPGEENSRPWERGGWPSASSMLVMWSWCEAA